ncbi:MAG: hypothetical protein Kow0098_17280 [Ignavibacteriaceae bacterium]
MKSILFFLVIVISTSVQAQIEPPGPGFKGAEDKIRQLEKLKLIETLKMDEETTLRFFARRTEYLDNLEKLYEKAHSQVDKMEALINSGNAQSDEYKRLLDDYLQTQTEIAEQRNTFLNSLNDILSYEKIARLVVFERKFKEEIRKIIFKDRFHKSKP